VTIAPTPPAGESAGDLHLPPTPEGPVVLHQADYTVRMADVDAASVIYYAAPLRWQEALVSEWFIRCGHRLSDQIAQGTG
jgi:hypothetical protein